MRRRGGRERRVLVVLGACLVGALLCVVALVALGGADEDDDASTTTTLPEGDPVAADEIEVGDCFNDLADDGAVEYSDFPVVQCRRPHDNEVFHLFAVDEPPSAEYPGNEQVASLAREGCLGAFQPYVGREYTQSVFEILAVPPSIEGWRSGDREVLCALYDSDRQPLTGRVRGANR
ncbi:hypothetical protein BH18ACT1_BH18ACT1_05440 [soil metagenome]